MIIDQRYDDHYEEPEKKSRKLTLKLVFVRILQLLYQNKPDRRKDDQDGYDGKLIIVNMISIFPKHNNGSFR